VSTGKKLPLDKPHGGATGDARTAGWKRVKTNRELRAMCALILRADRDFPLLAITCRRNEDQPLLAPTRVREIIGPRVPLFVVSASEVRAMKALLPESHDVFDGAARIWWPGVDEHSDPRDHPLFLDPSYVYGERILGEIAREFGVRCMESDLSLQEQLVVQQRLRLRIEKRNRELEQCIKQLTTRLEGLERTTPPLHARLQHEVRAEVGRYEGLCGQPWPAVDLEWGPRFVHQELLWEGQPANLAEMAARGTLIVYLPGVEAPQDELTMSRVFGTVERVAAWWGATTVGVSAKTPEEQQAIANSGVLYPPLLVCDRHLLLAETLGLPTCQSGDGREYRPLSLIVDRELIVHVGDPLGAPVRHAQQVLGWLSLADLTEGGG
jgi:peroxiredoxin